MANEARASLILELKDLISDQIVKIGSAVEKMGQQLEQSKYVFLAAFGAISAAVGFSLKQFGEQQLAITQLDQALANHGIVSRSVSEDLINFAQKMQNLSTMSDNQVVQIETQLIGYGLLGDKLKETTKLVVDMTAAGYDSHTAAQLLGKAFDGETTSLARFGITVDENLGRTEKFEQVMQKLGQRFGGTALAEQNSFIGSFERMKVVGENLAQTFGAILAPAAQYVFKTITELMKTFEESSPLTKALTLVIGGLAAAFVAIVSAAALMASAWPAMVAAMAVIFGPIGAATTAVLGLVLAFDIFHDHIQEIATVLSQMVVSIMEPLTKSFEAFGLLIHGNIIGAMKAMEEAAASAAMAVPIALKKITDVGAAEAKKQYDDLLKYIKLKSNLYNLDVATHKAAQDIDNANELDRLKKDAAENLKYWQLRTSVADTMLGQLRTIFSNDSKALFYIDKASALSSAIVNTAAGAAKALSLGWPLGPFMAGVIEALGAVQIGVISAQTVGFADGGMVMPTAGGTLARIGEAGSREAVLPLDNAAVMDQVREALGQGVTIQINAGTIIADDFSVKEFAKKIDHQLFALKQTRQSVSLGS